jgi:hypothetical protein
MALSQRGYSSSPSLQMACIIFRELKLLFKDVFLGKPRLAISSNGAYCFWGIIEVVPYKVFLGEG